MERILVGFLGLRSPNKPHNLDACFKRKTAQTFLARPNYVTAEAFMENPLRELFPIFSINVVAETLDCPQAPADATLRDCTFNSSSERTDNFSFGGWPRNVTSPFSRS